MIRDGLWDVYNDVHMGSAAELTATRLQITRRSQAAYAVESYRRALAAQKRDAFRDEIAPLSVPGKRKSAPARLITHDEEPRRCNFAKVPLLKPAFQKTDGTVTAANSSVISDGACAMVLCSAAAAKQHGVRALARILGYADASCAPLDYPTCPALAVKQALHNAGVSIKDVDLFEVNEAFAVVALANMKLLGIPHDKVNVLGGAVSLGHPIAASGARIMATLYTALKALPGGGSKRIGCASVCNGGGAASAIVFQVL
jgi:acetyl-CoA C-acetyltransferase